MQQNSLSIEINKPASEIFAFTLNPKNTPLWVDSIVYEEINTPAVLLGTHYKNQSNDGAWNEYEVVEFVPNESFTFKQLNSPYSVRYDFEATGTVTKMTYTEWVTEGELEAPFDMRPLEKLKSLMEF